MGLTNEQKLLILLQKAVENGWNYFLLFDEQPFEVNYEEGNSFLVIWEDYSKRININDLVLNFEKGKTDFIDALFEALIKLDGKYLFNKYCGQFKLNYILLPTSRRLEYLFTTFNKLLK